MNFSSVNFKYWILGISASLCIFLSIILLPDLSIAWTFLSTLGPHGLPVTETLFQLAFSDPSVALLTFYATLSVMAGADLALLVFYFKTHQQQTPGIATAGGILGTVVALIGFGCASCGALFLSLILSSVSGISLGALSGSDDFAYLLRIVGIVLLAFSLIKISHHIRHDPLVCPVE